MGEVFLLAAFKYSEGDMPTVFLNAREKER